MGIRRFGYRLRVAVGILLGLPHIAGRSIGVSPKGVELGGRNASVSGVWFDELPVAVKDSATHGREE
jgi:hypothetical protein